MSRIWNFSSWLPYTVNCDEMVRRCAILNIDDVVHGLPGPRESFNGNYPLAQLQLTVEDFDLDCFMWEGLTFVSEKMRLAMSLSAPSVQFFDIDSTRCASLPMSKQYQIMNVVGVEAVSDTENSDYQMRRFTEDLPLMPFMVHSIAIRREVVPKHQLFYDEFFLGYKFCTDELALRVLHESCTGVHFFDPARMSLLAPKRFHTLHGIEEMHD